ncbi:MAG: phosphoglycerate kinase [Bacteroidota bacterium]|nr:phosphoglycerate kinase [Bacteroidota bacterium]
MKSWKLSNQKVLLRVDFNVPISNGLITDDTRILKSLETINYLLTQGAKLIIMSHLGRPLKELLPDGQIDFKKFSLRPVASKLAELLNVPVIFVEDCGGKKSTDAISKMQKGTIVLLENTRFHKEEEKGDAVWAKSLSELGDYFINDAFGAAHREHATTATIARYFDKDHKAFGFLMEAEISNAHKVLSHAKKPFTAILGGAKVSDKIELITKLISLCDHIIIGGGMAYTFLKALGYEIGKSLCEEDKMDVALQILSSAKLDKTQIHLPVDSIAAIAFEADAAHYTTTNENIKASYIGLDIGPKSREKFKSVINNSKTILWNGPMGVFEMDAFSKGTEEIAKTIAQATKNGSYSLVGGGDSVAAINNFGLENEISFISTGGGAMLELLEGKNLPGIIAIQN